MTLTKIRKSHVYIFGIPCILMVFLGLFSQSQIFDQNASQLSSALILDFVLTIPILYFFLIRKTNIDKKTVFLFFILGIMISTVIIPKEHQNLLNYIKTWVVPIVELFVLSLVIINVRKAVQIYRQEKGRSFDLLTNIRTTCAQVFPKVVSNFLAIEITSFYYGFIHWKKIKHKKNEFTYHKNTGTQALLVTIIFIIAIETVAFHALLSKWSVTAAWILTGISIYSAFQIFGFLRSLSKRPIVVEQNMLKLRYGIMCESSIELKNIDAIELTTNSIGSYENSIHLSFLGEAEGHNILLHLKKEHTLIGLYGRTKKFKTIALFVDEKDEFEKQLNPLFQIDDF